MKPASEWTEEIYIPNSLMDSQDMYECRKRIAAALEQYAEERVREALNGFTNVREFDYNKGRAEGYEAGIEGASNVFSFAIETQTMLVKVVGNPSTKRDLDILVMYRDKIRALKSSSQGVDSKPSTINPRKPDEC